MGKTFFVAVVFLLGCVHQKKADHQVLVETNVQGDTIFKTPYYINSKGDTLADGIVVSYFDNHVMKDSFKMVNGFKDGFYYEFDSLGKLKSKFNFAKNKRDGLDVSFFPNGKIEIEELLKNDTLLYSKNYFTNGQLKSYMIFIEKYRTGYYLFYDSLGRKIDESGDSNKVKRW